MQIDEWACLVASETMNAFIARYPLKYPLDSAAEVALVNEIVKAVEKHWDIRPTGEMK